MSVRSLRRAAATTSSASATDCASGFSTNTCLPASRQRHASVAWVGTGVASTTASSSESASRSSNDVVVRADGKACRTRASCSSEPSQIQVSSASGSALKLRARLGPQ